MKKSFLFPLLIIILAPFEAFGAVYHICGNYYIETLRPITFTSSEKNLICGNQNIDAWKDVPLNQAKFHIKTFLQNHGYYFPKFKVTDKGITVDPGKKTKVRKIELTGSPPDFFDVSERRKIKHYPLTPKLLNTLENWTKTELQSNGYPCPKISTKAFAKSGKIVLNINRGQFSKITEIKEEKIDDINENILRRYDAFELDEPYNINRLTLTSIRTENAGIVQSSYFLSNCKDNELEVKQKIILGEPRLIIVGFGADTEQYGIGKLSWEHSRLGKMASSIKLSTFASYRKQQLSVESNWYLLPSPTRWFLNPELTFKREDEKKYELIKVNIDVKPAVTIDTQNIGMEISFGPQLSYTKTFRGPSKGLKHFLSGIVNFRLMSHDFEFYATSPRSGYSIDFTANLNHQSLYSQVTAQKLQLKGEYLWNVADFEPPLLVLGVRGHAISTITDRDNPTFSRLPATYLTYLGGSANLRGFDRKELPTAGDALTSVYLSAEARFVKVLPFNFQPLFFIDAGVLGRRSLNLDYPIYWSPGFGLRWPSPVGVFRTTFAHSYVSKNSDPNNNNLSDWQFFFSFGEEF